MGRINAWLQAGRFSGRKPVEASFYNPSRPAMGSNHPPVKCAPGLFAGSKAVGAWRWPPALSSAVVKEKVELYFYSPSVPFMAGFRVKFYNNCMCGGLDVGLQSSMELGFMWFAGKYSLLLMLLTTPEIEPQNFHKRRREAMISRYKLTLKHAQNFDDCIACLKGKYDISLRNTCT
jgi:hypothetical protein